MIKNTIQKGKVEYEGRAFHQDAMEAMRGDIVRGIIELITNSDDAYAGMDDVRRAKIVIEIEHRRNQIWKMIVRDRATGMSAKMLKECMTKLGRRTSGFEKGLSRRGNLGRGAKDLAAFGSVTFASIYNDKFSELTLQPDGQWALASERAATLPDRKELGITKGNGTVVTVAVAETFRCPRHDTLRRKLATHYQLRDILNDSHRRVDLVNLNKKSRERLCYEYPRLPIVLDCKLGIPGYERFSAKLEVWRLLERCDDPASDPYRPSGILIKGKRAIYDNTLFGFEGNVHAGWFCGRLVCPAIDQIANEYDDALEHDLPHDPRNPIPIISRRRDGLSLEHPFVKALWSAIEEDLGPLIDKEAAKVRLEEDNLVTDQTRSALERLAEELGRLLNEELRDIEAEELVGGEDGLPPLLAVVPEQAVVYMGEDKTLTVAARNEGISVGEKVEIKLDPSGVVDLLSDDISLRPHQRREDLLVGQIRIRPLIEGEATLVTAKANSRHAEALVEVKPPRDVIEEVVEPPETLQFERPSYRLSWQRKKDICILAPAEVVALLGSEVHVSSSDPGIVILGSHVDFDYNEAVDFYKATVAIEGVTLGVKAELTARLGELKATTHVTVRRKEEGPNIRIQLMREGWGFWRAIIEKESIAGIGEFSIIRIAGKHPAIRPYLGENFEGQNAPVCRSIIAEVVADVAARIVVSELFRIRKGTEEFDVDRFYREHYKRMTRFLPRFQRLMVGDPDIARSAESLEPLEILETSI